jgi:hypothetical protein
LEAPERWIQSRHVDGRDLRRVRTCAVKSLVVAKLVEARRSRSLLASDIQLDPRDETMERTVKVRHQEEVLGCFHTEGGIKD